MCGSLTGHCYCPPPSSLSSSRFVLFVPDIIHLRHKPSSMNLHYCSFLHYFPIYPHSLPIFPTTFPIPTFLDTISPAVNMQSLGRPTSGRSPLQALLPTPTLDNLNRLPLIYVYNMLYGIPDDLASAHETICWRIKSHN